MIRHDVITLLAESKESRGVHEEPAYTARTVFCTVRSIGIQEHYAALAAGVQAEIKFVLGHDFEYQGERRLLWHNTPYEILRTYVNDADGIELTAGRAVN